MHAGRGVLVTGAAGFIGRALLLSPRLRSAGPLRGVVRAGAAGLPADVQVGHGDLDRDDNWPALLQDVGTVVHTAARVHVMREHSSDPLAAYQRTNVGGTLRVARHAVRAGVKRFVFLSSIKVNGEETHSGRPYDPDRDAVPVDPYGISKQEAEVRLRDLARETGLEVVIVRPVLVYGPGVRGNFASLMRWLRRGVPLPLASIQNRRSLVGIDNLVDLIATCVEHPRAANQTFLVSDGEDLSTPELLTRLGSALGTPARLLPFPPAALEALARLAGASAVAHRLCRSLQVDITKSRTLLEWSPPITVDEGLQRAARAFLSR